MKEFDVKENYRLYYEYLKRSEKFKKLCDAIRKMKEKYPKSDTNDLLFNHLSAKFNNPSRLKQQYHNFGDVFSISFEKLWPNIVRAKAWDFRMKRAHALGNAFEYLRTVMDECEETFTLTERRKPTLDEFKRLFIENLQNEDSPRNRGRLLMLVSYGFSMDILNERIDRVLRAYKSIKTPYEFKRKKTVLKELDTYLLAYDLKTQNPEATWEEIIREVESKNKIHTGDGGDKQSKRRSYQRYMQKAKQIIKNAESANFPGKY